MKWDQFKYLVDETQPDVIGLSEHNRIIRRMKREDRPQEVIGKWQPRTVCRFSWLNNTTNTTTYEVGGTGIVTSGKGTTHTIQSGEDEHGMGRWTWISLQGKQNRITTIISIYRPSKNQATLDKQQAHTSKNRPREALNIGPQELWDKDLTKLVSNLKNKGHEIIVAGDWNDDLNKVNGTVRGMMTRIGLKEVLISRYGEGPETYQGGTKTIDGIFVSTGLKITQGGYTTHEASPSDHRWVWMDITEQGLLIKNRDDHAPPVERRATSKIPSVRNKFNSLLETQVNNHQIHTKLEKLYKSAEENGKLTIEEEEIYDGIEQRMQRSVKCADSNCRKVRTGKIPFSSTAQAIMRKLRILKLIQDRQRMIGRQYRPKMRKLRRLARRYNYKGPLVYDGLEEIKTALKQARLEYSEFKPRAKELRERHIYAIAQEKADEDSKGRTVEWHYKKLAGEDKIRTHFKYIRKYEGKSNRKGVDKVDIRNEDGSFHTVHDREEIAKHICKANIEKRQQARHTPCRMEPLSTLLGEQMEFDKWEDILKGSITLPREGIEEGTRLWYDMIKS